VEWKVVLLTLLILLGAVIATATTTMSLEIPASAGKIETDTNDYSNYYEASYGGVEPQGKDKGGGWG